MARRSNRFLVENPFYVSPRGAAQYVPETAYAEYQKAKKIPRGIEREVEIEPFHPAARPEGYEIIPGRSTTGKAVFFVYRGGVNTGRYGMDPRKAAQIAHEMEFGKTKGKKQVKQNPSSAQLAALARGRAALKQKRTLPNSSLRTNPLGKAFPTLGCVQFLIDDARTRSDWYSVIFLVDCAKPAQPVPLGMLALNRTNSVLYSKAKQGYGPLLYDVGAQYRGEIERGPEQSLSSQQLWTRLQQERGSTNLRQLTQGAFAGRYGDSFDTLRLRGEAALDVTDLTLVGALGRQLL